MHQTVQATGVEMAGSRKINVGRKAALAAADRVSLLLTVVEEEDAFLSEVLHSANATIADMGKVQPVADPGAEPEAPRPRRPLGGARGSLLGPAYHNAKQRALRLRGATLAGRGRPLGRA